MSGRTIEASRAIRLAWQKEQAFVRCGYGTRDWTIDQQIDIELYGKAYDEDGRAFEGHHMKSVEKYPELQGDSENIQFLTRDEHLDAHGGDFRNPTDGYYDYIKVSYPKPGNEISNQNTPVKLSNSLIEYKIRYKDFDYEVIKSLKDKEMIKTYISFLEQNEIRSKKLELEQYKHELNLSKQKRFEPETLDSKAELSMIIKDMLYSSISDAIYEAQNNIIDNAVSSRGSYIARYSGTYNESLEVNNVEDPIQTVERKYTPNDVPAGEQRYHLKDGSVVKRQKEPYHRGGKKND